MEDAGPLEMLAGIRPLDAHRPGQGWNPMANLRLRKAMQSNRVNRRDLL